MDPRPRLTVIVPVFNEERTVGTMLTRLATVPYGYPDQEVIVVDDGSTDRTAAALREWAGRPGFTVLRHPVNRGKGAAVRTGLQHARGRVTVIQDADLEYDPAELPRLVEPIERGECEAAFGSRYLYPTGRRWTRFRLAVAVMNGFVRLLYGVRLTDVATCYKVLPTDLYQALALRSERFELCAEMTAKLCRLRTPVREVPISYTPRSCADGKKIGWRDAVTFGWALLAWRFKAMPAAAEPAAVLPPALVASGH